MHVNKHQTETINGQRRTPTFFGFSLHPCLGLDHHGPSRARASPDPGTSPIDDTPPSRRRRTGPLRSSVQPSRVCRGTSPVHIPGSGGLRVVTTFSRSTWGPSRGGRGPVGSPLEPGPTVELPLQRDSVWWVGSGRAKSLESPAHSVAPEVNKFRRRKPSWVLFYGVCPVECIVCSEGSGVTSDTWSHPKRAAEEDQVYTAEGSRGVRRGDTRAEVGRRGTFP